MSDAGAGAELLMLTADRGSEIAWPRLALPPATVECWSAGGGGRGGGGGGGSEEPLRGSDGALTVADEDAKRGSMEGCDELGMAWGLLTAAGPGPGASSAAGRGGGGGGGGGGATAARRGSNGAADVLGSVAEVVGWAARSADMEAPASCMVVSVADGPASSGALGDVSASRLHIDRSWMTGRLAGASTARWRGSSGFGPGGACCSGKAGNTLVVHADSVKPWQHLHQRH